MNESTSAVTERKPVRWPWLLLVPAIILLITYGYLQIASGWNRSFLHIFPNGFTGPSKILLDPAAPPLGRSKDATVLRYGDAGLVKVNKSDFEDLSHWAHHEYIYADGKRINSYIPHTGQVTPGPWIEHLPREALIIDGKDSAKQAFNSRIGTMSRK
ncbi:MAG: hypothetical protein H7Y17_02075 [Chlorobia bacterium]|nr:hypothetical protein [Fimbriimonadaceae bacterium]